MRALLLKLLRLKERPDPPPATTGEVSMFRASPRFFWYSMLGWAGGQIGALFGILIPLGVLDRVLNIRLSDWMFDTDVRDYLPDELEGAEVGLNILGLAWRVHVGSLINWVEIIAITVFVVQLIVSFLLLRLAWEMRWYIVTDTAIRIREGLVRTREQTLTIAKIQNMKTHQGPIQRLFGIAELEVQTAGGGAGGSSPADKKDKATARLGRFRGLEDATGLRDRLRALQSEHGDSGIAEVNAIATRRAAVAPDLAPIVDRMLAEARGIRAALEAFANP